MTASTRIHWQTGAPSKCGYYLVTRLPRNHTAISVERAQDYAEEFVGLAWYNPNSGWFHAVPGSRGREEKITHLVTHWAERPAGARPTAEQMAAADLRKSRRTTLWFTDIVDDIYKHILFARYEAALSDIDLLRALTLVVQETGVPPTRTR